VENFANDLAAIERIDAVPRILEVVCRTTGLGFAAVARVTETRWVACAVRDAIAFGLTPGGELPVGTTICNEIRQHGRLVVIDDVAADDGFRDHPTPQLYGFRSYISVPIVLQDGTLFGTLCGIDPQPHRLNTRETVAMFTLFAELIAFQLDAKDRVVELEARVAQRTAALEQVNRDLAVHAAASDADREALRSLTQQLEGVREAERTRIARELHDELGQALTALKLDLELARRHIAGSAGHKPASDALDSMAAVMETTLDAVERIISELRPAVLDRLGIAAAAEWLVGEFGRRTMIRTSCQCDDDRDIERQTATVLFRVLQEALTNVSRHAAASEVNVTVRTGGGEVELVVSDDGRGVGDSAIAKSEGFGLIGMRERLRGLNGSLEVTGAAGGGTRLVARCELGPGL
jgi:signal transduction histidine kinase